MKGLKMLAIAALALSPVAVVAAPASAAPASAINGGSVATPAGWGTDFADWFCRNYGVACP
ncbi:hypothetical protein GCM10017709_09030 [Glutamicibacter nicotianae]|jgi:hypothetical protein|uniref:Uncharacterized protein n=1 Tax=Glutamicibacter nicotianae TaxID=37929 RepID=A0ABQ0RJZ0_GLUNI|nr:hypothetical protein [Glutamicibacter nicotianae]GEC12125.1 hypothetical protein ANI01nite_13280 [Glutamicibacter nicotianae]